MVPGGLGPWFVSLLFNTSEGPKKQTHLCVHTYPHHFENVMNRTKSSKGKRADDSNISQWVTMMIVGPFDNWHDATAFHSLWSIKTRGKVRRLQRGLDLLDAYCDKYNLTMWAQDKTREQLIEERKQRNNGDEKKKERKRPQNFEMSLQELERNVAGPISVSFLNNMQKKRK